MGAGFSCEAPVFKRRSDVSRETRARQSLFDTEAWEADVARYRNTDLSRTFAPFDQRFDDMPTPDELREILARMNKFTPEDELDCGACGYETCHDHAVAIWQGLAEAEMCLPYSVEELRKAVDELQESNRSLASTKEALVKSEKLASMGQLAAGIAHEVNNPLNIANTAVHILKKRLGKLSFENPDAIETPLSDLIGNIRRAADIVGNLRSFSHPDTSNFGRLDLREIVQSAVTLTQARGSGIDLEISIPEKLAVWGNRNHSCIFSSIFCRTRPTA